MIVFWWIIVLRSSHQNRRHGSEQNQYFSPLCTILYGRTGYFADFGEVAQPTGRLHILQIHGSVVGRVRSGRPSLTL